MIQKSSLEFVAQEFVVQNGFKSSKFSGKGAFKETFCIIDSEDTLFALKLISLDKYHPNRTRREISAMKKCDTPLIGKLIDTGKFTATNNKVYFYSIEEYLDSGTLSDKINNSVLSPGTVKSYALTLTMAISYLKNLKLVHRDIKPDNIMFRSTDSNPVLVDLGLVRDLSNSSLTLSWLPRGPGTPYFSSPEQLNNEKQLITWKSDQFSLGIVLGICLTGQHPFQEENKNPQDAVDLIVQRKNFTDSFIGKTQSLGFHGLLKMLSPWPIQRFHSPETMFNYFKGVNC